ncbi:MULTISPECIES: hypothetical protein [Cupriavidus]
MTEKLDSETRLLAAIAYGESSTSDVYEEMAALASVMVRQCRARGYKTISEFVENEKAFSFVVVDDNQRYRRLMRAKEADMAYEPAMSDAVKAARNAMDGGNDYSNGAFFWDGADIKTNYRRHFKVRNGIRFSDPSHNIYGIQESSRVIIKCKITKKKVKGKVEVKKEEMWRYDHVYDSTAAYGGTIFWKQSPEYLKRTGSKEYL